MTNIPYSQYIQLLTAQVELQKCQRDERIYLVLISIMVILCSILTFKLLVFNWKKETQEERIRIFVSKLVKRCPDFCILEYDECPLKYNKGKCKNHILSSMYI